jgi:putative ABC transport system permease protein
MATPYAATRAATAGPDIIGSVFSTPRHPLSAAKITQLVRIGQQSGVAATSGPIPITWTSLRAHGLDAVAEVEGRAVKPSKVDQPRVVGGTWLRPGGAVVERAFAEALGVRVGDTISLGGGPVRVVGIAVSAALPPYPQMCTVGCILDEPHWGQAKPGLVWLLTGQTRALATMREPLVYFDFLRLTSPTHAPAFAAAHGSPAELISGPDLVPWQEVARRHAELLADERAIVIFGSSLLIILALATVIVLVGGRMADEVRRVGTLKAVGASPGYVVRILLASYFAVALVAAALGLAAGRVVAPLLVSPSAGLLGRSGPTAVTIGDAVGVFGAVLAVVLLASTVPAWRAARTSTMDALADSGRRPRRISAVVALSAQLPAPVLVGLRLTARRPRRAFLTACSIAVAVSGSVVVLYAQASLGAEQGPATGPTDPNITQLHSVMLALTVLLAIMAAVNLVFVTRAAATDARLMLAVVRALGASPDEAAVSLGVAQLGPALVGLAAGMSTGVLLFHALATSHNAAPTPWAMAGLGVATLGIVIALTAVPTRLESRRPIAAVLREA